MGKKINKTCMIIVGIICLSLICGKKEVLAGQEALMMSMTPELSTIEEPQRSLSELLDLEHSRIASTGVNSKAPVYVTFQLKEAFLDWTVNALNYQNMSQPSEYFLVDMNKKQEGNYVGERATTDAMPQGEWKLSEVWVMSPRRVVLCILRSEQEEEAFGKFDFTLMKEAIIETGTEQGSLVERPEEQGSETIVNATVQTMSESTVPSKPHIETQSVNTIADSGVNGLEYTTAANTPIVDSSQVVTNVSEESANPSSVETIQETSADQEQNDSVIAGAEKETMQEQKTNEKQDSVSPYLWGAAIVLILVIGVVAGLFYLLKKKKRT